MSNYHPVPMEEDRFPQAASFSKHVILWTFQVVFFLLSLTMLTAGYRKDSCKSCSCEMEEPDVYSPAKSAIEYTTGQFQGNLNLKSVYKGTPRKELDDAWDALSPGSILPGPTLTISEEDLRLIGKYSSANATVKIPERYGGGYLATLEVFHNLHCLNLVRMATYKEHYEQEHAFGDHWLRSHVDHCIDMIRQRLTCTADVGLVTAVWVKDYSEPYPEFSTRHQCRNFDRIRDWALERSLNVSMKEVVAARGGISLAETPK